MEKKKPLRVLALTAAWVIITCALPRMGLSAENLAAPVIRINEFLADNDSTIHDEYGEYDDVLELYNPGPGTVDLGGMYLTDDLDNPTKFRISDGTSLQASGFLLFWADNSPGQGPQHTNFALSKSGESIGLFDTDGNGNGPLDTYSFGAQATGVSEGRCPDGGQTWFRYTAPTIGATNEPCGAPPAISATQQTPEFPRAGEAAIVSTTITGDGVLTATTLWYNTGTGYLAAPMEASSNHGYQGVIPGQEQGAWVQYYVEAKDDSGRRTTDPPGAPQRAYSFVTGYQPPPVVLNELVSDNVGKLEDPDEPGEYPDWLELRNGGTSALDLGGLYLTDDLTNPLQFAIQDGVTIPAGGYLAFYADGEPEQGPLHTNFKLSASGEALGLFGAGGKVRIDAVKFPALPAGASYGRQPDGRGNWGVRGCPTPGRGNQACDRLFLPQVASYAEPPPLPLRLDCGATVPYTTVGGTVFLADVPWGASSSYGYLGGYRDVPDEWWEGNPVGGTGDAGLYKSQRRAWQEYRVSQVPSGDYLLTLRFEEQGAHGVGVNVFDIVVEGKTRLDNFDVYAHVGRYHTLDLRFAVRVSDGELNIVATPLAGEAHLSALEIIPRPRDLVAPRVPVRPDATPSYGAVLLDWPDNLEDDLAGYDVYRAERPDGPYVQLTVVEPAYLSRYQDNAVMTQRAYYYRIAALDVFGNASSQSTYALGQAIGVADATLPLYQLQLSPQNLAILNSDPWSDERVPAVFTYASQAISVEVRFRGSAGRTLPKKSWKIKFPTFSPFPDQDRVNVDAMWLDSSLIHSKLATSVFEAAGVRPPQAEHVLLALNGEYMGVYTRNEEIDEAFLRRTGRNPGASIYKVVDRFAEILPNREDYNGYYEKETNKDLDHSDVIAFIELINNTPEAAFPEAISAVLDVEAFLDYYAVITLVGDADSARHNIYMVHDLKTDKWELVPWDLEIALYGSIAAPIDMGTKQHPVQPGGWNMLRTRVLAVPEFRAYYCRRLSAYMDTIFSDAVMFPQVDAVYGAIRQDGLRDWRKAEWEANFAFQSSPSWIKDFVHQRKEFLRGEMTSFCRADERSSERAH